MIEKIQVFIIIFLFIAVVSFIYTIPIYIFQYIRGNNLNKLANKFNLKYEKNYSFLSLCPLTRMIFSKEGFWSLYHIIISHKINGYLNNHKIEIYDLRSTGTHTRIFFNLISTRTVVKIDDKEQLSPHLSIMNIKKIDSILSQL